MKRLPGTETRPLGLQRKRVREWRMLPGGVCVTRPGLFGNLFTNEDARAAGYKDTQAGAVAMHRQWLAGTAYRDVEPERRAQTLAELPGLAGRHLYCYCSENRPCHRLNLLRAANPHLSFPTRGRKADR